VEVPGKKTRAQVRQIRTRGWRKITAQREFLSKQIDGSSPSLYSLEIEMRPVKQHTFPKSYKMADELRYITLLPTQINSSPWGKSGV
jgi:hypothetical protein